jgi:large subunit ribosomal protein L7Ae
MDRLKVPPTLNQFNNTLDKNTARQVLKFMMKYQPETRKEKKQRLYAAAVASSKGDKPAASSKPVVVKYGLNHITTLVEQKKASLVVIAHDVEPIELVVWLPTLCRKMDVPYMIIKGKSRLGTVVHKKTATALAITGVSKGDQSELATLVDIAKDQFNNNTDVRRTWGGGKLGNKANARNALVAKRQAKEFKGRT